MSFVARVPVSRFTRNAPYASIRVSFHPGQNNIDDLIYKALKLEGAGFRVGIYGITHPDGRIGEEVRRARDKCLKRGLDFRTKSSWGNIRAGFTGLTGIPAQSARRYSPPAECRTSELIVDPSGEVYRCHADLYSQREPVGHILEEAFDASRLDLFRPCANFGSCNPCDVKVKTNRFQEFGTPAWRS